MTWILNFLHASLISSLRPATKGMITNRKLFCWSNLFADGKRSLLFVVYAAQDFLFSPWEFTVSFVVRILDFSISLCFPCSFCFTHFPV